MEQSTRLKSVCCLVLVSLLFGCSMAGASSCDIEHVKRTMGILYGEKNPVKAKAHIEACAEKKDAASQIALAIVYVDEDDNNTIYDQEKGLALAESAALQGYAPAQRKYAIILDNVTTKDEKTALEHRRLSLDWHYKAASQGHPDSLFQIGNTFQRKSYDKVSAYMWYWLALKRSKPELDVHQFIVSGLKRLKSEGLTQSQIREALKLAEVWEKKHPDAAKSWPTDDYVENLNGKSKALIPSPKPGPVTERFCHKFGPVITICPQYNWENDDKVEEFRKNFYGVK